MKSYYGPQAEAAGRIFAAILNDLQPEPYDRESNSLAANWPRVEKHSPQILEMIELAIAKSADSTVRERFSRIKVYVEFFVLYTKAYHTRKKEDLANLSTYSKTHPEYGMIVMYPGYIHWRNEEYFQ